MALNRPVTVVVLAKYKEIFENNFLQSCSRLLPGVDIVLVHDGQEIDTGCLPSPLWTVIQGPEQFSMAGNGNLGLKAVPKDHDVLYCGDDVRFLSEKTIEKLQEVAYSDEKIGVLSPKIIGRGSPAQVNVQGTQQIPPFMMWFPCVYIKREVFDKIGYLDEQFNNFGSDDLDFCIRAVLSGFKLCVTDAVAVEHEASPEGGPSTFVKKLGVNEYLSQQDASFGKFREKWKLSNEDMQEYLRTGNIEIFRGEKKQDPVSSPAEAMRILKAKSLYIATPAYGGMMTVNYVNSLLGLITLCREVGVQYKVSFKYNESLIPRARNEMAHDFTHHSKEFTDFIFIDADIGFEPRDILSLLIHDEEVVGAPCVRKSLNWKRIINVVNKNGGTIFTDEQMMRLGGEYVINFPPDATPSSMNLGQMIEVMDVGTGIMRIKREVFDKVEKAFPDRWYMPMGGEATKEPTYMFFQSGLDEDSKTYNKSGLPDYVPEDYAFCRLCRKTGVKVWLAPWMKTSHMGAMAFQGDLVTVAQAGGNLR